MQNIKELYILGKPITTSIGDLRFVKVGEYNVLLKYIGLLTNFNKNMMIEDISKQMKILDVDYSPLYDFDYVELIKEYKEMYPLYDTFKELFLFMYNEDKFDEVKDEVELEELLELMRGMNGLKLNIENENPEIAYFDNLEKELDNKKNPPIPFEVIYSMVAMFYNEPIDNLTIYKMNVYFERIGYRLKHNQTVLYSSVDSTYKIEPWYGSMTDEKQETTLEDEENFAKNIFG